MRKKIIGSSFLAVIAAVIFLFGNTSISLSENDTTYFVTEEKEEYRVTIDDTESAAKELMVVSESRWKWNLLNGIAMEKDRTLDILTGQKAEQEGNILTSYISIKNDGEVLLYAPDTACVAYYNEERQYLSGERLNPCYGCLLKVPEGCCYLQLAFPMEIMEKSFIVQTGRQDKDILIVSKEDTDYTTISQAVLAVQNEGIIFILPGIYQEQVRAWGKNITLYGMNREVCILESYSSSYYAPPLEISCGYVTNLTIRAVDKYHQTSTLYAYGVHVEDNSLTDQSLKFENCSIYSDFNSAVGIGLRGGCEVEFVNVQMTGKENGLFCHDSAYSSSGGVQNISLISCRIEGMEGSNALRFDSQGIAGSVINVRCIDNTLVNGNSEDMENLLYTRNNGGQGTEINWQGLKNYYLSKDSLGNNVKKMNFCE